MVVLLAESTPLSKARAESDARRTYHRLAAWLSPAFGSLNAEDWRTGVKERPIVPSAGRTLAGVFGGSLGGVAYIAVMVCVEFMLTVVEVVLAQSSPSRCHF